MLRNLFLSLILFSACLTANAQPSAVYSDCADITGCVPNAITASSSNALSNKYFTDNVGIGTPAPSSKLQVVGTVSATAFVGDGSGLTGVSGAPSYQLVDDTAFSNEAQNTTHSTQILTYNGNQYLGYIDSDRYMQLCKRPTGGQFTCYKYDGSGGRINAGQFTIDNHNTIALGVDESGYIHVTYNMHAVALKYRRSLSPEDVSGLSATQSFLGTNENAVTYPMFFNDNSGNLYVIYRNGVSGNGDHYLYKYTAGTTSWAAVSGTGTAGLFIDGQTDNKSAYINLPVVDASNVAHFSWIWRNDASPDSSEDIAYVKWDITNGTFKKYDGTTQTVPIRSTNDLPAYTIATGSGLLNGTSKAGIAINSLNRPAIVYNKLDSNGNTNVYLVAFNGSSWTEYGPITKSIYPDITQDSDTTLVLASPAVVFDDNDRAIIFYRNSTLSHGVIGYESQDFSNWNQFAIYNGSVGKMSISFDASLWKASKVLNMVISPVPLYSNSTSVNGSNAVDIGILEWNASNSSRTTSALLVNRITTTDDFYYYSIDGDFNVSSQNVDFGNNSFVFTAESSDATRVFRMRDSALNDVVSILSNGNIGIGSTNPAVPIDIKSGNNFAIRAARTDSESSTGGAFVQLMADNGTSTDSGARLGSYQFCGASDSLSSYLCGAAMEGFSSSAFSGSNAESSIRFSTAPSGSTTRLTRMIINSNGNIGIGTTAPVGGFVVMNGNAGIGTWSPTQKLQVVGTVVATAFTGDGSGLTGITSSGWTDGGTNVYNTSTTDNVAIGTTTPTASLLIENVGTQDTFRVNDSASDTTPFLITSSGNIGIGTTVIERKLDMATTGNYGIRVMFLGPSDSMISSRIVAAVNDGLPVDNTHKLGEFLVSGYTGDSMLESGGMYGVAKGTWTTTSAPTELRFDTTATGATIRSHRMTITPEGNVGIGTIDPDALLNVIGTVKATSFIGDGSGITGLSAGGWTDNGAAVVPTTTTDNIGIGTTTIQGSSKLNVGGGHVRIGVAGTNTNATSAGELYVEGDLEVDGTIYGNVSGNADTATTATTANNLAADGVDALTEIAQSIKTAANDTSAIVVGTAGAENDCAKWDANGNLVTAGAACGSGSGGINNVIEDTTPQLGGDLDVNGMTITSASNGNVIITPNGTGRVGVGTVGPTSTMQVVGTVNATAFVGDGSGLTGISGGVGIGTANTITFWPTTTTIGSLPTATYPSLTELSYVKGATSNIQTQIDGLSFSSGGWADGGTNIYTTTTTDNVAIGTTTPTATLMVNNTGTVDSFRVDDSQGDTTPFLINSVGNVGIGTTGMGGKLSVGSTSQFQVDSSGNVTSGSIAASSSTGSTDTLNIVNNSLTSANALDVSSTSSSQTVPLVTLTQSGNASGTVLTVTQSGTSASGGALLVSQSGTSSTARAATISNLGTSDSFYVTDQSSDPTPFVINSVGNVGIGTTGPSTNLHLVGEARITGLVSCDTIDTDANGVLACGTDDSSGASAWVDGGTNVYVSPTTDNVGIGTTTPTSGFKADVRGNLYISGNVGVGTASPRTGVDLGSNTLYVNTITGTSGGVQSFSGNVGIGTITAGSLLTIGSTGQATVSSAGAIATSSTVSVGDDAYAAGWNGSTAVPTKNALYDKIETLGSGGWTDGGANVYLTTGSDNVGIGTSTPSRRIAIHASGADDYPSFGVCNSIGECFRVEANSTNDSAGVSVGSAQAVPLYFQSNDASYLTVNTSGSIRFLPTDTPDTCNAGNEGGLYYDNSLNEFCDCDGSSWAQVDGGGAC